MAILLPKHLQASIDYASQQEKVAECKQVIEQLLARSVRTDLEAIVHRKYPRMPVQHILGAPDDTLWGLAEPEVPEVPKYLYMNREDFYDVDEGLRDLIESYELEPIWNDDIAPGRVTVLTESGYKRGKEIGDFHRQADADSLGIVNWLGI